MLLEPLRSPFNVLDILGDVVEQQVVEKTTVTPKIKRILNSDGSYEITVSFNPKLTPEPQVDVTTYDNAIKVSFKYKSSGFRVTQEYKTTVPHLDHENVSAEFVSDDKIVITCPVDLPDDDDEDDGEPQGTINIVHKDD